MLKRLFRSQQPGGPARQANYPCLEEFDRGRRDFLIRLGATVLGAGLAAQAVAGCEGRPVDAHDAGSDGFPSIDTAGVAPPMDARVDTEPDFGGMAGVPRQPDARVEKPDIDVSPGGAPMPDAAIDKPDIDISPGVAPMPDARADEI